MITGDVAYTEKELLRMVRQWVPRERAAKRVMGDKTRFSMHLTNTGMWCVIAAALLLTGCGTFAPRDPAAPASHHAQRKYDEAVGKGTIVPAERGKEDRK